MATPILDKTKCTVCKTCEDICPAGCFSFGEDEILEDYRKCMGCGKCIRSCPVKALSF